MHVSYRIAVLAQLTSQNVDEFSGENTEFFGSILDRTFKNSHAIEAPQIKPVKKVEFIT
jgi:hypothetical protein